MNTSTSRSLALLIAFVTPALALSQPLDLSRYRMIDLTHPQGRQTSYWPNSPSAFKLDTLAFGMTPGGFFYSSFAFSTPEHGGTPHRCAHPFCGRSQHHGPYPAFAA